LVGVIFGVTTVLGSSMAVAKNVELKFPIKPAISSTEATSKLGSEVKFYFGDQSHASVSKKLGAVHTSTKTNSFWKDDDVACNRTFLSSLLNLKKQAKELGANAVINITSSYKGSATNSSKDTYTCGTGAIMNGTQLKGEAVKI
jgi:hypothetical protein